MICRLCLNNLCEENAVHLFQNEQSTETGLTKMIAKYFYLEISEDDSISPVICQCCCDHLEDFHKFWLFIEQKQSSLRKEFFEVKCDVDLLPNSRTEEITIVNGTGELLDIKELPDGAHVQLESELEVIESKFDINDVEIDNLADLENDNFTSNDDEPLWNLKSSTTKVSKKRSSSKTKTNKIKTKLKKNKLPKEVKVGEPQHSRVKSKTDDVNEDNKNVEESDKLGTQNSQKQVSSLKTHAEKDKIIITKYLQLKCEICKIPMEKFSNLQTHSREVHNCKAYIICCGRRFHRPFLLADHIRVHLDPHHFQCKPCQKSYSDRKNLDQHIRSTHPEGKDLKFKCPDCERAFVSQTFLKQHSLKHVKEKNFACQQCEKAFATKNRLTTHVRVMHDNVTPYVCDICGQKFKFKQTFDNHIANHQGIVGSPEQCKICGEWLKNKSCLQAHVTRHEKGTYVCSECSRECPTKRALVAHIRYIHQLKRIFKCTFCEKSFKTKGNLNEHIAMHTDQKHHSCDYCTREFRSKANMYAHVKKNHFEEWTKKRIARSRMPIDVKPNFSENFENKL